MKKNYGFKEGEIVFGTNGKAEIIKIFNAGKNQLGFKHALIEYQIDKKRYLTGLKDLRKHNKCINCKYWFSDNWCANNGLKVCSDDFCCEFELKP